MKKPLKAVVFMALFLMSTLAVSAQAKQLLGTWQCRTDYGTITLVFKSEGRIIVNDEEMKYQVLRGVIRLIEDYGHIDYPYQLRGQRLTVTYPEGYSLTYTRVSTADNRQSGGNPQGSTAQDRKIFQLLTSSAWKSFSYGGDTTGYSRSASGYLRFYPNGIYTYNRGANVSSQGWGGESYSEHKDDLRGQWKVQNGVLYATGETRQFKRINMQVEFNSNGYPILKLDGVEYCQAD